MRSAAFPFFLILVGLFALATTPASAQAGRTWVSGVGDDANPCSRTAPCKTFAGAIAQTAAGGEIDCLDPGGFGALTITKAISIICEGVIGGVLVGGTNGITVAAGTSDVVVLSGLDLEGGGSSSAGLDGIAFNSGAALHVRKTQIRGFAHNGINFQPSGAAKLFVVDTYISESGATGTAAGIQLKPSGGSAIVAINNTQIENNGFGIVADGSATSGTIRGVVRNSVIAGSAHNGITTSNGGAANITLMIDGTSAAGNAFGLVATGANSGMIVGSTSVTANGTGLFLSGGGAIYSYGTNYVNGNTTADGAFTSTIPEK
jgi:hypothetical protein